MGKPKNKGKSKNVEEDSDTEMTEQKEEVEQPASKPSKKDRKKKKQDDDWEGDVASELASMTLEVNKGRKEEEETEEEPPAPVVSKKDKKKKKKQIEDDEEDDDVPVVSSTKKAAFSMLMMDDDDDGDDNVKSGSDDEQEETKQEEVQESSKPQKKKDKKKKEKNKGKAAEEEDIDALLAEIDKPAEKSGKKKKGKKNEGKAEDNDADAETEAVKPEIVKVEPKVVTIDDLDDEEDDKRKRKKKKGKESEVKMEEEKEDKGEEEAEGEEEGTVKTAAQKRKEKKEREKKKLAEKKKMQAMKKESKLEGEKEKETKETEEKAEESIEAEKEVDKADDAEKKGSGDEGEGEEEGKKKKKKKKGEKSEKEEKVKKPNARIKAMQEILRKQKEEEERLQREEEERIRKEEEAIAAAIEKKRLEEQKKQEKKERQRLKREQLKAEGKLLTAAQKQDRKRAMEMLELMKAQGIQIPDKEETKKKRPVYDHKKKKQQKKEDTPETEETPSPSDTPASTPMQEDAPELESKDGETEGEKPAVAEAAEPEKEEVKDEWDASSEEEEEEEEKESSPEIETKIEVVDKKEADQQEEEESDEEEEDEESEEEEEEEESEEELESEEDGLTAYERAEQRIKKRHEKCEANRTTDKLRAPVVCVLGHVDTGKTKILDKLRRTNVQDGEAGGITQQIGATNVPAQAILEKTTMCKEFQKKEMKLPGLLIIDTPGHESFSNLRSRGSSLCDIAILVIDIMHGLEQQTIESINLLKERKTPFVVALNKIDRLYQWKTNPNSDVMNVIKKQSQMCKQEFEERKQAVITQLAEQSLNAALFYENKNPKEYVSLVPTSAHSGDGMGNLLSLICELTQTWLAKKISYSEELHATVMEVKALPGLGTTIDVILVNGKLKEGDHIILAGTEGPIVTQIRGLLMPQPMRELRVKSQYEHHKEVYAAQGVKVIGKDLEKALAGLPLYVARDDDEIEYYKEELSLALKDVLSSIKLSERGVFVQASTLGSLEALLEFLRTSKIPYAGINIGPVHRRDIMKASIMLEHDPQWAVILAFDVKVERDAQEMADSLGVNIFTADIIYHLQDKFLKFREDLKNQKKEEFKHIAVFPCKLRVLPQHIFNKRDPIVVGVVVEAGVVKLGTPICVPSKENVELGQITSIEVNHKPMESARRGQEVCIKIENIPGETPKLYGRHFDHTDMLISKISRNSIDAVKEYFRDEMQKQDWTLMVELKKLFQIL